jgi:sec-independent protein translocase protein TatC
MELLIRTRRIYISVFVCSLCVALMPQSFLKGNFVFDNYSPAIYSILSLIINHSVKQMLHFHDVQIVVSSPLTVISACIEFAFLISMIINVPIFFHQFYRFVEPGLYSHEKRWLKNGMLGIGFLFFLGASISYFFVLPVTLGVLTSLSIPLLNVGDTPMVIFFTLDSILSMVLWTVVSAGLLYTLPGFIYILVVLDIVEVDYLIKNRKNVILAILIFAAVITPDPTIVSMLIISAPLLVIYEIIIQQGLKVKRKNNINSFKGECI